MDFNIDDLIMLDFAELQGVHLFPYTLSRQVQQPCREYIQRFMVHVSCRENNRLWCMVPILRFIWPFAYLPSGSRYLGINHQVKLLCLGSINLEGMRQSLHAALTQDEHAQAA